MAATPLTTDNVIDDENVLGLPPGQAFTGIYVYDKPGDATYIASADQIKALLFPPTPANQSPVVTLNITPNGITLGQSAVFTATATDPDGVIVAGTFTIDGVPVAVLPAAPFTFTYTPTSPSAVGTHQIGFSGLDNGGATGSTTLPLVVVAAPVAAAPAPVITFAPVGNKTVGDASVTLSVSSTNTVTPITIVSSNGAAVALTQSGGVYTANFPAAGTSTLTAVQAAGNGFAAGNASQAVVVSAAATQKPNVVLEISPDNIPLGGTSTFYGSPSSANSTIVSVLYRNKTTGATLGTATSAPWTFAYTPTTAAQVGQYPIEAVATDALGVQSNPSNSNTLTVSATPPNFNTTVSATQPAGSPGQAADVLLAPASSQQMRFNAINNASGNVVQLQITDASDNSISYVSFLDDYANQPFAFDRANGTTYYGTFPNKDTNFTA